MTSLRARLRSRIARRPRRGWPAGVAAIAMGHRLDSRAASSGPRRRRRTACSIARARRSNLLGGALDHEGFEAAAMATVTGLALRDQMLAREPRIPRRKIGRRQGDLAHRAIRPADEPGQLSRRRHGRGARSALRHSLSGHSRSTAGDVGARRTVARAARRPGSHLAAACRRAFRRRADIRTATRTLRSSRKPSNCSNS